MVPDMVNVFPLKVPLNPAGKPVTDALVALFTI